MKSIGYAVVFLGLAVSAKASVLGLVPAASEPQQYYAVTITASPIVPITNAYFFYGNFWQDGDTYSQEAYGVVPIGNLPAASATSPDVVTVDIPQIYITDPRYAPIPVLPSFSEWDIEGLYTPGGVSLTDPGYGTSGGSWPWPEASESSVASALASGNVNTLLSLYEITDWAASSSYDEAATLFDYSSATANGTVNAVINPTPVPEPTSSMLVLSFGAVSLLRRRPAVS